jgi:hypothetical protein
VNYLTLDVQTGPTDGNEQNLLLKHLPKVERGDILLLDRGYPGTALFACRFFYFRLASKMGGPQGISLA